MEIQSDILLDIDKTFDFIDAYLPGKYSREVCNLLPKAKKVELDYIRRVKTKRIKNLQIIIALYRVAQFHKIQTDTP